MIAYRVVTVPERLDNAMDLALRVGAQIVLDESRVGTFHNHLRALASVHSESHVVVLEDDAILCPDFLEHVARLIGERPNHLIGLYVGRSHPARIQPVLSELTATGDPWLDDHRIVDRLRWAVGYVMPAADIPAVLEFTSRGDQHAWIDSDKRIGAWHAERGMLSYPFPSPVDHDDSLPSTTSQGRSRRVAWAHCEGVTL